MHAVAYPLIHAPKDLTNQFGESDPHDLMRPYLSIPQGPFGLATFGRSGEKPYPKNN